METLHLRSKPLLEATESERHFLEVLALWELKTVSSVLYMYVSWDQEDAPAYQDVYCNVHCFSLREGSVSRGLAVLLRSQTIDNSSSLNEGTHDRQSVWISVFF